MNRPRRVGRIIKGRPTLEGAGVHLSRIFGFSDTNDFDPFLLLDHFGSNRPEDYLAGFPWHPHRGIETITYILKGKVAHGDSLGNRGVIGRGDVQWMTAGSGIIHQEMPEGDADGAMEGFQLWANLPSNKKMTDPRYQEYRSDELPCVQKNGATIRVIAGKTHGASGPVKDVQIAPEYLDIALTSKAMLEHSTPSDHTVFCYVFEGRIRIDGGKNEAQTVESGHLALLTKGDIVTLAGGDTGGRLLLVSGNPLREPVAWAGPIVMNTQAELDLAFEEYRTGRFIKKGAK